MNTTSTFLRVGVGALMFCAGSLSAQDQVGSLKARSVSSRLEFEVNDGQTDGRVRFLTRHRGMTTFITSDAFVVSVSEPTDEPQRRRGREGRARLREPRPRERSAISMRFVGANPNAEVQGLDPLPGVTHYLLGNDPSKWRRNVRHFARVLIKDAYPGIDVMFHGEKGALEYDFVVHPGADAAQITLEADGAQAASVDADGALSLRTKRGQIRHLRPDAGQDFGGKRRSVGVGFTSRGPNRFGLDIAAHDRNQKLEIDPLVVYSDVFGGGADDSASGVAADAMGNTVVVGRTEGPDFPGAPPVSGPSDVFLRKLDSDGTLLFAALIGGSDGDDAAGVRLGQEGSIFVAGTTTSADFPLFNSSLQGGLGGGHDAFAVRLIPDGSAFSYATRFGGTGEDKLSDMTVDRAGALYAVGSTDSPDIEDAIQSFAGGDCDGVSCTDMLALKFDASGRAVFAMYLGGAGHGPQQGDLAHGLDVDQDGNIFLAGYRGSNVGTGSTAYFAKLSTTAPGVVFEGTLSLGECSDIAVDSAGQIHVVGHTDAAPTTPDAHAPDLVSFETDAFLVRLRSDGEHYYYATFIGRPAEQPYEGVNESPYAVAVDLEGNSYVAYKVERVNTVGAEMLWHFDAALDIYDPKGRLKFRGTMGDRRVNRWDTPFAVEVDPFGNVYLAGEWGFDAKAAPPNYDTQAFIIKLDGEFLDVPADCQDCGHDIGLPVNLFTGNVWLSQTDAVVGGIKGLALTRSYNSMGRREPLPSGFGTGWTHPFDKAIAFPPGKLRLREGNGVPIYFTDPESDGTYTASVPATERSSIVKGTGIYTRHFKEGGSEVYDSLGRLTQIVDVVGSMVTLEWTGADLTRINDPGGRALTLSYNGFGRIVGLSGPNGSLASYGYGTTGLLETVDYPDGTGYRYEYDERGQLLFMKDPAGRVLETHTYEGDKAITSSIAGGQEQYTLNYVSNIETQVTDADGKSATYTFGTYGGTRKVETRTGPCASCGGQVSESWTYTTEGRVDTYTDGVGRVTTYAYWPNGDLQSETTATGTAEARTVAYTWDAQSRPLTRTAPGEGTREWTDYEAAGPRKTRVPMDATRTRETATVYNPTPQRPNQPAGSVASVLDADGNLMEFEYFEAPGAPIGDLRWTEDARGYRTFFSYDGMGRRNEVEDAMGNKTTTVYDVRGRVEKVQQIVTLPSGSTTLETVFAYNNRGLKESVTDPAGKKTQYTYDDYGRLQSVIDADGKSTVYSYDAMSRVKSIRNARNKTWSFEYDTYGRLEKTIWPGGRTETLTYKGDGQLETRTDRRGVVTTYAYDGAGRLQTKTFSDGTPTVTYTYDDAGRLESASSSVDTLTRNYLLSGELQEETSTRAGTTLGYEYTLAGRRTDTKLNGQPFVEYGYTSGLLSSITRGTQTFALGFDPATRRYVLGHPNGLLTEYQYDEAGRLLSVKFGTGTPDVQNSRVNFTLVLSQVLYTYDKAGNRVTKAALDHAETYDYDRVDRLESVVRTGAGAREWSFGYDAVGNRKGRTVSGILPGGGGATQAGAIQASYNDRNELQSYAAGGELWIRGSIDEPGTVSVVTQAAGERPARMVDAGTPGAYEFELEVPVASGPNSFTVKALDASGNLRTSDYQVTVPADSASYSYDLAGNLETKTDATGSWIYDSNGEGQLTRVRLNNTEVAHFTYDPFGRRAQKVAGAVTTTWAYDGDDIVQETVAGGSGAGTYRYVHGPSIDEPLARETVSTGALEYFHADGLGSIIATTNQAGVIVSTRRYDAWGNLEVGATVPGYAFTGREWDPETGLYYYRARYYDPKVGRFVSEDPIGFVGGANFYSYVENNPALYTDARGLAVDVIWDAANVSMGIDSLEENLKNEEYLSALLDALGIGVDCAAAIAPGVPGGAGTVIKAIRARRLLGQAIKISRGRLKHVLDRHTVNKIARYARKSKFNPGEDVVDLINMATHQRAVKQANGNFARTFDVGREIGIDRATSSPTTIMTVVTDAAGNLITAHPGRP